MSVEQNIRKCFDFSIESLLRINKNEGLSVEACDLSTTPVTTSFATSSESNVASLCSKSEANTTRIPDNLETFSWLHCTRFKPPKLPRSRKRGNLGKRLGRGPRIPFSPQQIAVLENTFSNSQYLSSECINRLANALHLSETRVKIWFQNRRARFRREKDAQDCQDSSGRMEIRDVSLDKNNEQGNDTSKTIRKRNTRLTSTGHFLAFQIQSGRELSARIPALPETYINDLEAKLLKETNYLSTPSLVHDINDFSFYHQPHRPLLNDLIFPNYEHLTRQKIGLSTLMKMSENRMSANSANITPSSTLSLTHQPRIY